MRKFIHFIRYFKIFMQLLKYIRTDLRLNHMMKRIRQWLSKLSFRTGLMVAALCAIFYIISFAQMLLPLSASTKGILWATFFGLAKTAQYTALLILGKAGIDKIKARFRRSSTT